MLHRGISDWFIRLRWFAFLGQALVLAVAVVVFRLTIPWPYMALLLIVIPLSNILAARANQSFVSERQLVEGLLIVDTLLLTGLLLLAGGPTNPFTLVYLLHVVIAAIMLSSVFTWIIAILSCACFASLFLFARHVPEWGDHGMHSGFSLHLHGMLIAYISVSLLVAYFLDKIVGDVRARERRLQHLEDMAQSQKKLATLAAVSAEVAHELGTPLGTIGVISHEVELALKRSNVGEEILEDVKLLKDQVNRCKKLIQGFAEKTGERFGESLESLVLKEVVECARALLKDGGRIEINIDDSIVVGRAPRGALTSSFQSILKNALEASVQYGTPVSVSATQSSGMITIHVEDRGNGMDQNTLERVGEPFFSTKAPGSGMGLGVYLSKLTLHQIGGDLTFRSQKGMGTIACVLIPNDCVSLGFAA